MSAVVVGAGLAGLLAARKLTAAGHDCIVLEAGPRAGGMIAPAELGGVRVDGGAEAYAVRSTAARALCEELGLDVAGPAGQPHVWWQDMVSPLADGVLGIPGSLDDPALRRLTRAERARVAEDLELGPDVGADETTAGGLMAARMGRAAVDRLMAPLTTGVYRSDPMTLPLAMFAPKLVPAMREHGSLLAAVAAIRQPGQAAVEQPVGGMFRLVDALADGIDARTRQRVTRVQRDGSGFAVESTGGRLTADRLVIATDGRAAHQLLTGLGARCPEPPAAKPTHVVLLACDHPALGDDPVGSGLLMGDHDPAITARALTHYSRKWPWVDGTHVLRLSYAQPPKRATAIADASALTRIDLERHVEGFVVVSHAMPARVSRDFRDEVLHAAQGVDVVGAWIDGNGIGPVIEASERIR